MERRIKNIMNDNKSILVAAVIAVVLIIVLMIGLLTNSNKAEYNKRTLTDLTGSNNLSDENDGVSERVSTVTVTPPKIQRNTNLGADAPVLDYAGNDIIIFHGYFGLFVYSIDTRSMIGAMDLKSIGCDSTQGDNYCEVNVSSDGTSVYLHPISEDDMYVYNVLEKKLSKEAYSMEGIDLFDKFADSSTFMDEQLGSCSERGVEFHEDGYQYYGYLIFPDWTIGDLKYVEGDMIFLLFDSYFKDYKGDMLSSGLYGMNIIQSELSNAGATFQIFNNSDQEIEYGEEYKLQQKKNDSWIDVPYIIDNWAFTDIAYSIPANESKQVEVDWRWLYGNLPAGEYLFIKNIIVEKDAGIHDNIPLCVEFQISDGVSTENAD